MANYVTVRRWAMKEGASEDDLVAVVRDGIVPAYRKQPGCLSLNLLRLTTGRAYLAVTYWESRAAFDAWAGPPGEPWRAEHRATLERWLELMVFQEEWDADLLIVG
jgi:heme-degrading monooxygenase HmoA